MPGEREGRGRTPAEKRRERDTDGNRLLSFSLLTLRSLRSREEKSGRKERGGIRSRAAALLLQASPSSMRLAKEGKGKKRPAEEKRKGKGKREKNACPISCY